MFNAPSPPSSSSSPVSVYVVRESPANCVFPSRGNSLAVVWEWRVPMTWRARLEVASERGRGLPISGCHAGDVASEGPHGSRPPPPTTRRSTPQLRLPGGRIPCLACESPRTSPGLIRGMMAALYTTTTTVSSFIR